MEENLYTPNCIRTNSGRYVNVVDPDPATFHIDDIAHALCRIPRFGGHLPQFYSVAQHCVEVAKLVPSEYKLTALMHDASEAYLLDIPKPLKDALPEYKAIEHRFMERLAHLFGFSYPLPEAVKLADEAMLHQEWDQLMLKNNDFGMGQRLMYNSTQEVYRDFLGAYARYELMAKTPVL